MGTSLHVSLPDEMRRFVDARATSKSLYATPSEYVRDLIRRDMERLEIEDSLRQGLDDANRGNFAEDGFVDKLISSYPV